MKKYLKLGSALALVMAVEACAPDFSAGNETMRGKPAEAAPPPAVQQVTDVPKNQSTYHYMVDIYPGLDGDFDPSPTLTLKEYNEIVQLDWYCAKKTNELAGMYTEMAKQGVTLGILEGIMGMAGAFVGFGAAVQPLQYLAYTGLAAAGGGLANGKITFDLALNIAHGYCMTGMVYKADELDSKLRRIFIVPVYVGHGILPQVSNKPTSTYPSARVPGQIIPPAL